MLIFFVAVIFVTVGFSKSHFTSPTINQTHFLPLSKHCKSGDIAVNDCNQCVCTTDHYLNCIPKPCKKTVVFDNKNALCEPNILYIKNNIACICKEDGTWPHEACETEFNSLRIKPKDKCIPNTYVFIDCNVCKCGVDGKVNRNRCTVYNCNNKDDTQARRYIDENPVYGSCEADYWYSLAPCQFCFCISQNKLVCNTGNSFENKLQLGSYNLSICGKDLIKEAISLIPDKDKDYTLRYRHNWSNKSATLQQNVVESDKENYPEVEVNRENIEHNNQQIKQQIKTTEYENKNDSEEFYTDETLSNEAEAAPAPVVIGREGLSTKLPYEEDENNSDSESEILLPPNEVANEPAEHLALEIDVTTTTDAPVDVDEDIPDPLPPPPPSNTPLNGYPEHFEWTGSLSQSGDIPSEAFNLGEVLKPYLPVVLDKVFQMALRKSMVSVDSNANCTPGATTVYKCNACFCLKNKKLLCTNHECQ